MRDFVEYLRAYLGQSWLGQSPKVCTCVACRNVCPARIKDVTRVAELGGSNVDDCLGVSRLYFCALRNVETSSQSTCELKSARPKIRCELLQCKKSQARRSDVVCAMFALPPKANILARLPYPPWECHGAIEP